MAETKLGKDAVTLPVGTTAQRPANPEVGMMRFNTDQGSVEWYDELTDVWVPISEPPVVIASGGTVTDIEQDGRLFRVHTFTSDGTFDVARGGNVDVLIVGGGGSGGNGRAGGGGGGGVLNSFATVAVGAHQVTVGAGGLQSATGTSSTFVTLRGNSGEDSTLFGFTAVGGGGGGSTDLSGLNGGSGGGAGNENSPFGTGTAGQGNDGGAAGGTGGPWETRGIGSGGGGAVQPGFTGGASPWGKGGDGVLINITGTPTHYAGGGGGSNSENAQEDQYNSRDAGLGGLGGGGRGQNRSQVSVRPGVSGEANTGGGGGGTDRRFQEATFGGSGIVIVRYRIG